MFVFTEVFWTKLEFTSLKAVIFYESCVELDAEKFFFWKHISKLEPNHYVSIKLKTLAFFVIDAINNCPYLVYFLQSIRESVNFIIFNACHAVHTEMRLSNSLQAGCCT